MERISELRSKMIAEGIEGKYIHGAATTFGYVQIKSGSILPEHRHVHEQITFILEGQLEMKIGGEKVILEPGSVQVIPSNVLHSAVASVDCTVIDVFSPARDDYK